MVLDIQDWMATLLILVQCDKGKNIFNEEQV